jgi:serine/threonine protein kinase
MLYEMATGRRAFQGDSPLSIMAAVLREEPPPIPDKRTDLPAELTRWIVRCLRKDPERRAHSMADLRVAMEELREESISGTLRLPAAAREKPSRRSPLLVAIPLAAILAIAAYSGWRIVSGRSGADIPLQPVPLTSQATNHPQPFRRTAIKWRLSGTGSMRTTPTSNAPPLGQTSSGRSRRRERPRFRPDRYQPRGSQWLL